MSRPNNPRIFAEVISLLSWKEPTGEHRATKKLFVDINFRAEGRVGSANDPVSFRLSLKSAAVHVRVDPAGILKIVPSSIKRENVDSTDQELSIEENRRIFGRGEGALELSDTPLTFAAEAGGSYEKTLTRRISSSNKVSNFSIRPWKTSSGWAFQIESTSNEPLSGTPWAPKEPLLRLYDTKADRSRGEPPNAIVELRCKREDLIINDIELSEKPPLGAIFSRNKIMVAEQYIKDELCKIGFEVHDTNHRFSDILLSDTEPEEWPPDV